MGWRPIAADCGHCYSRPRDTPRCTVDNREDGWREEGGALHSRDSQEEQSASIIPPNQSHHAIRPPTWHRWEVVVVEGGRDSSGTPRSERRTQK